MTTWTKCSDSLPILADDSVLAYFSDNDSIDMVHIIDFFAPITAGIGSEGEQLYTRWYLRRGVTHWMALPNKPED